MVAWRVHNARAAAALASGAVALAALLVGADSRAHERSVHLSQGDSCQPGSVPTHRYGERPPEEFFRYATRPVVIGCAALRSGRRFELVGYQLARGNHSALCIDENELATGIGGGCGSNLVHGGGAIDAGGSMRSGGRPIVVSGALAPSVRRVVVRYELGGRLHRTAAVVVRVREPALLQAIDVRRPFGRYLAEVPRGARAVTAEARSLRGRRLGLAFFEGFRGPVGEARACYRRPRITSLRLLAPARAGRGNRVRVAASYPGGYIGSVEAAVSRQGTAHADLVPVRPRQAGSRRIVQMPVRFKRRGTTAIDVTAEGLPLSRRCGKAPPLRKSPPKTLVVRVR